MNTEDAMEVVVVAEAADAARGGPDEAPIKALAKAGDTIVPAIEQLLDHDLPAALRLVGALSFYWQNAGRMDEGRALTERAIALGRVAANDQAVTAALPRALLAASNLAFRQGDQAAAEQRSRETIAAAASVGDLPTAAIAHTDLARVAYRDGNAELLEHHARTALEMAGDDKIARRGALHMLAWAAHTAGDLAEARRRFEQSLAYRRESGNRFAIVVELANLADMAADEGDLPTAARMHAEALAVSHEIGSQYMLVNEYPSFAALALAAGLEEDAARLFGAADAVARSAGLVPDPGAGQDEARVAARARVGEDRFQALALEGEQLSADDAVALALSVANRIQAAS